MAYNTITLKALAAQTAAGSGAWQPIPTATMGAVLVDVTAGTAVTAFDLRLQGAYDSSDTTGYDIPLTQQLKSSSATINTNQRDVVDAKADGTAERFVGLVPALPFRYVRAIWTFSGTSITFGAYLAVK